MRSTMASRTGSNSRSTVLRQTYQLPSVNWLEIYTSATTPFPRRSGMAPRSLRAADGRFLREGGKQPWAEEAHSVNLARRNMQMRQDSWATRCSARRTHATLMAATCVERDEYDALWPRSPRYKQQPRCPMPSSSPPSLARRRTSMLPRGTALRVRSRAFLARGKQICTLSRVVVSSHIRS